MKKYLRPQIYTISIKCQDIIWGNILQFWRGIFLQIRKKRGRETYTRFQISRLSQANLSQVDKISVKKDREKEAKVKLFFEEILNK